MLFILNPAVKVAPWGRIAAANWRVGEDRDAISVHPAGEQPVVDPIVSGPVTVDNYAGRIDVDRDPDAAVTKQAGLFDEGGGLPDPAPVPRHRSAILGTVLLSVLSGHPGELQNLRVRTKRCIMRGCPQSEF